VEEVDSTNARLKEWAAKGEAEGAVLIAGKQSAGRGRRGRGFFSPAGTGLYMSVLLRPRLDPADTVLLTPLAAVAACRAIGAAAGQPAGIKWVNDILLGGQKVGGILAEGIPGAYVVLGIGINLFDPPEGFPAEIAGIAGSVFGREACLEQQTSGLMARLLGELYALYTALPDTAFMREYRALSLVLNRRVRVLAEPGFEALAEDIDDCGALMLRKDDGERVRLCAGEVSVRLLP
jgi:BirA family biotin operon repressor/biotin-[acetyl-CoA-carboxylase] ligase